MADEQNAKPDKPQNASQQPQQRPLTPASTHPEATYPENIRASAKGHTEPAKKWFRKSEWWLTILTGLLVFVGIATAWVFLDQLKETRRQTKLISDQFDASSRDTVSARRQARQQIRVLGSQTRAAQESVVAVQRQMRQDQRAWLRVTVGQAQITAGMPLIQLVTIQNFGKTPAKNLLFQAVVRVVDNGSKLSFPYSGIPRTGQTDTILWPNDPDPIVVKSQQLGDVPNQAKDLFVTPEQVTALQAGKSFVLIYGKVTYLDIFDQSHWTNFCGFGSPVEGAFKAKMCTDYNAVDNN